MEKTNTRALFVGVSHGRRLICPTCEGDETMKSLAAIEKGVLAWVEVPTPEPGPYEALVRMEVCGWCNNTDWLLATGNVGWAAPPPLILGHESIGTVVAVGERVTKFRVGDRVTRPYGGKQGSKAGDFAVFMGGFSEFGLVSDGPAMVAAGVASPGDYTSDRQNVVPAGVSALDAALAISLAETSNFVHHLGPLGRKRVLVAGTGVAGISMALWAKLAGAERVVVLGRRESRLALAREIGADAGVDITRADDAAVLEALGGPADLFLEAVGSPEFLARAGTWLAPGGLFAPYGLIAKDAPSIEAAAGLTMAPCIVNEHENFAWVVDLMRRGLIKPAQFRTHVWEPAEAVDGIAAARRGDVFKGFVHFGV